MKILSKVLAGTGFFLLILMVLPILYILTQSLSAQKLGIIYLYKDFIYVLIQSILSASLSLLIGLLIAISYLKKASQVKRTLYWGLLPQALPTVLIVFAYFKIFSLFGIYPQSYVHVICAHIIINMGLVAFLVFPHLHEQAEKKIHIMVGLQLSLSKFFRLIITGELAPILFYIWILVFSFSMTSFSVPLLLSGNVSTSLDYLIYVKGYVEGDWASASLLGLIEFIFLGGLFVFKSQKLSSLSKNTNIILLKDKKSFFYLLNYFPLLLIAISVLHFGSSDMQEGLVSLQADISEIIINTLFLVSWSLWSYTVLFWSQVFLLKYEWVRRFHQFYWPLSPILMAFVMLSVSLLLADDLSLRVAASGLTISLFVFPIVFKFWVLPEYANLKFFYQRSEVLDLSYPKVYSEIIVPYFATAYKTSIIYILLFTLGDFTLTGILLSDLKTIGLSMRSYIQRYQIAEAQILAIILIAISLLLIFLYGGKAREYRKV